MKFLKLRLFKSLNSLIVFLISLLGFSTACSKDQESYEYGVLIYGYSINGNVNSSVDNHQIQDIKIEMYRIPEIGGQPQEQLSGSARSDLHGRYELNDYSNPPLGDHAYLVRFTDVDGPLNGEYQSMDTTVVFQDVKFTGGDGKWNMGTAKKEVYIKLKPKE
jgi:putative lipoprotein (rSAM/lipoprotein system)